MSLDSQSLAHTSWNCKYHIVFAPKYRRNELYGLKRLEIGAILRKLCDFKQITIHEAFVASNYGYITPKFARKVAEIGEELDSYGGYVYEGIAADALHKSGAGLYYSNNKSELDFVIQEGNEASLLEVKMAKGNAKSAKAVTEGKANRHASKCYMVTGKNFYCGSIFLQ